MGTLEACRRVGIGRKTGYRWRAERGGLPPLRLPESERGDRYLSLLERKPIATLRERRHGVREIARRVKRTPSTISRDCVAIWQHTTTAARMTPTSPTPRARARRLRPRRGRLVEDSGLRAVVQARLELEWSPEQIAAWLRDTYPDRPDWHVCHETIYQALYHGGQRGLSRQLTAKLRTGRPLRKRRRRSDERSPPLRRPGIADRSTPRDRRRADPHR